MSSLPVPLTKRGKIKSVQDAVDQAELPEDPDPDPYGYAQELEETFGLDILPVAWKARPTDSRYTKRIRSRARMSQVARLHMSGMNVAQIAQKLRVSEVTVYKDLQVIQEEWRQTYLGPTEQLAAKNLARLESYLVALNPGVERGDVKSIGAAIEVIKEMNSIVGVRQGVQVDIEQYIREVAESKGFDPEKAVALAQKISVTFR